jgi:hypothetical protein
MSMISLQSLAWMGLLAIPAVVFLLEVMEGGRVASSSLSEGQLEASASRAC